MTRPWENLAGITAGRDWEAEAGIYSRTITVKRPADPTSAGTVGYSGVSESQETVIVSGVVCNISVSGAASLATHGGFPADSPNPFRWSITIPLAGNVALPLIMERDLVYDDLGRRYQVSGFDPSAGISAVLTVLRLMA
jgi:hypothetical protein